MFLGLDLSLTGSGVARLFDGGCEVGTLKNKLTGMDRLQFLRNTIKNELRHAQGVAIENYSFGSKFGREALGELGGVIRLAVWESGVPYVVVAPQALKKFATGTGNAVKGAVMVEVFKRYGITSEDDNQADAVVLANIAECVFGPKVPQFAYQQAAIKDLEIVKPYVPPVRSRTRPALQ